MYGRERYWRPCEAASRLISSSINDAFVYDEQYSLEEQTSRALSHIKSPISHQKYFITFNFIINLFSSMFIIAQWLLLTLKLIIILWSFLYIIYIHIINIFQINIKYKDKWKYFICRAKDKICKTLIFILFYFTFLFTIRQRINFIVNDWVIFHFIHRWVDDVKYITHNR